MINNARLRELGALLDNQALFKAANKVSVENIIRGYEFAQRNPNRVGQIAKGLKVSQDDVDKVLRLVEDSDIRDALYEAASDPRMKKQRGGDFLKDYLRANQDRLASQASTSVNDYIEDYAREAGVSVEALRMSHREVKREMPSLAKYDIPASKNMSDVKANIEAMSQRTRSRLDELHARASKRAGERTITA